MKTPITFGNVFVYLVVGIVIGAGLLGTIMYFIGGESALTFGGKLGAGIGLVVAGIFGLSRRFR